MQHLTRKLLLICLLLWLPLQGYAATMMPFCAQGKHDQQTSQQGQDVQQDAHAGHDQHHSTTPCDNCSLCHLCSAMALPSFSAQLPLKPDSFFAIPFQAAYSPIFLEQPQRPPLALTA